MNRIIWLLAMILLMYCVNCDRKEPMAAPIPAPLIKVQDFTLKDVKTGQDVKFSTLIGTKIIVLDFWASWCPHCVQLMPELEKYYQMNKDRILVVGVNEDTSADAALSFTTQHQITYPILFDADGKIAGLYKIVGVPTTLIVNHKGEIINQGALSLDQIKETLNSTSAPAGPATAQTEMSANKMKETPKGPQMVYIYNAITGETKLEPKIVKTDAEWRALLTPEEYAITRLKETERPFSTQCTLPPKGESGVYQCVCCGTDLFIAGTKFESGTGWPSFWDPVSELNIKTEADNSLGMNRNEVLCARCNAHLGHVFDDGPPPTGKRYCMNAGALKLTIALNPQPEKLETAIFAAGCFWGVQSVFDDVTGVAHTTVGYTGGHTKNPTYEKVCTDKTGHAESVQIVYHPGIVSYNDLLDIFWYIHDPTTKNRQGPDVGSQYRSAIFYLTPAQEKAARLSMEKEAKSGKYSRPIVTEITAATEFYPAEEYHQEYNKKNGLMSNCHLPPPPSK